MVFSTGERSSAATESSRNSSRGSTHCFKMSKQKLKYWMLMETVRSYFCSLNQLTSSQSKFGWGNGFSMSLDLVKGLLLCDPGWRPGVAPLRKGVFAGKVLSNISGLRSSPKVTFFFFGLSELYCSVFSTVAKDTNCLVNSKQSIQRAETLQGLFTGLNILWKITPNQTAKYHPWMPCGCNWDFQFSYIILWGIKEKIET